MTDPFAERFLPGGAVEARLHKAGSRGVIEIGECGVGAFRGALEKEVLKRRRRPPSLQVGGRDAKRFLRRETERGETPCHPFRKARNRGSRNRGALPVKFTKHQGSDKQLFILSPNLTFTEIDADPWDSSLQGIDSQ
jgi:hypothetical protein